MGTPCGAVLVVTFAPGLREVLVGLSKKEGTLKFHGGQICSSDTGESASETLFTCAKRELQGEAGLEEGSYVLRKLGYKRQLRGGAEQYNFCALLKEKFFPPNKIQEEDEMGLPFYASVVDVLRGAVNGQKMNPYHRIAFAACIQEMQGWGNDKPEGFAELLGDLYLKGIIGSDVGASLMKYIDGIRQAIRERRI